MPDEPAPAFVYVLRRLSPDQWKNGNVLPIAFRLHLGETALSVYAPGLATPRRLLQDWLNARLTESQSGEEAVRAVAEKRLQRNGTTVEAMYAAGWRVARVPNAAFEQAGLVVKPPSPDSTGDQIGHCDVPGTATQFRLAGATLLQATILLTEAETLA